MNCRICNTELLGKASFMSWLADGSPRGPFCVRCTRTPLIQMELMEMSVEAQKEYMTGVLGYTPDESYP